MADRKISELNSATRVFDADYMVVVTGVNQTIPNQDVPVEKVTTKFPLSGLATWVFRVNEVVSGVSGIRVTPVIGTGGNPQNAKPNSVLLSTTGVSFVGHQHTTSDITNFNSSVNNLVEQHLKYLETDKTISEAGSFIHLTGLNELQINLPGNTKYVGELGLVMSGNNADITGMISTVETRASNYGLLGINGTWNYFSGNNSLLYNSSTPLTGQMNIANDLNGIKTLVNHFTVSTFPTEPQELSFSFTANSINNIKILAGSWLKVEKVI
jgi:hypothetical protein